MLSNCIPIYNFDCTRLVNDLVGQAQGYKGKVEINVMDDASTDKFRKLLQPLSQTVNFFQLNENVGRSKIRNLLAEKAKFDHILFIDGDSSIINSNFLSTYISSLEEKKPCKVICGGSVYSDEAPSKDQMLRWKYSKARERKSTSFSKKYPYQSFTTNNFIIDKEVFSSIKFDERIEKYGHEDTLFGYQLKQREVSVRYLNNVVLNGDIDTNENYLRKTRESISNLLKIAHLLEFKDDFIEMIPLLKVYFRIKLLGLEILLRMWFRLSKKRMERNFAAGKVNLTMFDFYRLGILSTLFKRIRE